MYFHPVETKRAFNTRGQPDVFNLHLRPYREAVVVVAQAFELLQHVVDGFARGFELFIHLATILPPAQIVPELIQRLPDIRVPQPGVMGELRRLVVGMCGLTYLKSKKKMTEGAFNGVETQARFQQHAEGQSDVFNPHRKSLLTLLFIQLGSSPWTDLILGSGSVV